MSRTDFYVGISFRPKGSAIVIIQGSSHPEVPPVEEPWMIVSHKKIDQVSVVDLAELLLSALPDSKDKDHYYLCGSDRAILEALRQIIKNSFPNISCFPPKEDEIQGIAPAQFLPHVMSAFSDGFLGRSADVDLDPLVKDLNTMEFADSGMIKSCTPSSEAFLYSLGELTVRFNLFGWRKTRKVDLQSYKKYGAAKTRINWDDYRAFFDSDKPWY